MDYKVDVPELRAIAARKGYNIGTLSKRMGVCRDTVSAVFHGQNPTYPVMCKMMKALAINPEEAASIFFDPILTY